jgi:type VI secretion system protein VasD
MITRRIFLGTAVALLVTGCSSPPPPPAVLTLNVIGSPDQNPDPSGQSVPVAVRLFQLNDPAKFERADVFALTEREQQTLGAEGQGSEEFVLRPGETRTVTRELKKGVQFVGVVVLFRDIDHAHWRAVSPVAASGPSKLTLRINGLNVVLA